MGFNSVFKGLIIRLRLPETEEYDTKNLRNVGDYLQVEAA